MIPQIQFYNLPAVLNGRNEKMFPAAVYYNSERTMIYDIYEYISFQPIVNATQESHPNYVSLDNLLWSYNNGAKLVFDYTYYIVTNEQSGVETHYINFRFRLLDNENNAVGYFTATGGKHANYNPNSSTRRPYSPLYLCPGRVSWTTNTQPTIEGESANHFATTCFAFSYKPSYTGDPVDIGMGIDNFQQAFDEFVAYRGVTSDAEYRAWLGAMYGAGDGSNPVAPPSPPSPTPTPGGDPAGSDDTSEPGGGDGNYNDDSDPVDFPDLPTGGAIESGAVIAHRVSKQTLEVIFTKLWNKSLIDITNVWQKSIQDPMDAIVSLHALPISPEVENDPNNIAVGNLDMGVTSPIVTSQYVEVDCGTLNIREFWGSALDYSPYTRVEIFLPFIGIRTLRTEDVMKSTLHIKYHVDVLSGDCIAFIKCGISVLYTYNGNCKMLIPLSSRSTDFLQKAAIAAGLAVGAGAVAVGGGAAAAAATKAPAVAAAGITQSAANLQAGSMLLSGASNVASTKINTQRSGDISSALSLMADFVPYLIIHRPVQSLAKDYNKYKGYTSNITAKLGDLTGYTEVEHVHLQNIPNATDAELAEIHSLLVGGVII